VAPAKTTSQQVFEHDGKDIWWHFRGFALHDNDIDVSFSHAAIIPSSFILNWIIIDYFLDPLLQRFCSLPALTVKGSAYDTHGYFGRGRCLFLALWA